MKYKDSKKIFKALKKSKNILINVHRSPDSDSVGSALAFYELLTNLKKEVKVICPDELVEENIFLPHSEIVEKVNFEKFDFSKWDIFLILDSASWDMVTGFRQIEKPNIKKILIDHHITSKKFGDINLIDDKVSSTSELVYILFKDWKIRFTNTISKNLLAGIIGDTGVFEYPNVTSQTMDVARHLMEKGADKDDIVVNVYRNYSFNKLKFWGEIIKRMEFDEKNRFVYSAIPFKIFKDYQKPVSSKEMAASMFCPVIKGADFGLIMIEEEEKKLSMSFRSKKDFDVSKIAEELGGGGHKSASGATIRNIDFDEAVKKVLRVVEKYAQKDNKLS